MAFFGKKKTEEQFAGVVGVDIGTLGVKVVELVQEAGKPRLTTYGYAEFEEDHPLTLQDAPELAALIDRVCAESGVRAKKVYASLPASEVFHAVVSIPAPATPNEDLRPLIEAQAQKVFPLPLEEMVLDSRMLEKKTEEKFIRVFLTGAPKRLIDAYIALFAKTKLTLVSLETEVISLLRAIAGGEQGYMMLIDIGGKRTTVMVSEENVPLLTRGIKSGGDEMTRHLMQALAMSFTDAETAKRDLRLAGETLPPSLKPALAPLVHEMEYALRIFTEATAAHHPEKILLSGASAHVPGLAAFLAETLHINTYVADPWLRIACPPAARPILSDVGPRLAIAAGLALRMVERDAV